MLSGHNQSDLPTLSCSAQQAVLTRHALHKSLAWQLILVLALAAGYGAQSTVAVLAASPQKPA